MKITDIINRLDKENNGAVVDTMVLGNELGIYDMSWIEQERLNSYWVGNWHCTDSMVGYKIYFLDNEPVAWSSQTGRKSDETFFWFSEELAKRVRDYLLTLEEPTELSVELCDIEQEMGIGYQIDFSGQLYSHHLDNAYYNNIPVKIIEKLKHETFNIDTLVVIQFENEKTETVHVKELEFGFNLKN